MRRLTISKLVRSFGSNNVDHCTRLCHASSVAALMECVNSGAVSAPFMSASDADCIIVIGARPTENHPVAATYLNAAKRGSKLVVMDPRKQGLTNMLPTTYNLKQALMLQCSMHFCTPLLKRGFMTNNIFKDKLRVLKNYKKK